MGEGGQRGARMRRGIERGRGRGVADDDGTIRVARPLSSIVHVHSDVSAAEARGIYIGRPHGMGGGG